MTFKEAATGFVGVAGVLVLVHFIVKDPAATPVATRPAATASAPSREAIRARSQAALAHRARELASQATNRRREVGADDRAERDIRHVVTVINDSDIGLVFTGFAVKGEIVQFSVDGNVWEYLNTQDRDLLKNRMPNLWTSIYCKAHGAANCAGSHLSFTFFNLAADRVAFDSWNVSDAAPR